MSDSIANGGCCSGSVRPGTYGDATDVAQITVDKCGRITKILNVAISGGGGFIQPLPNLVVSNSVTTTNVFASNMYVANTFQVDNTFFANTTTVDMNFNTLTITYINTSNIVVSNLIAAAGNINVTGNVVADRYYGDGGFLSNIASSGFTQPLANLVVSNSVTTTNVFASNMYVANTFQVDNTFFANTTTVDMNFNTLTITYINTSNIVVSNLIAAAGNINVTGNVVAESY